MCGTWRQHHTVSKLCKEGIPEWIIFIKVQNSWDTDCTTDCFIFRQRFISKESFIFVIKQIWNIIRILNFTKTAFTTVSGDMLTTSGEFADSKAAMVRTALADCHAGAVFQMIDLVDTEHTGLIGLVFHKTVPCNQSSTKCSHDTGDVGTDYFNACNLFKASENGIIIESATLHNNVFA